MTIDAAVLIREKYPETRWSVPLPEGAVAATLNGSDASPELAATDGPHGTGLYIFADSGRSQALTAQHEWSQQHFLETEGSYIFWSALRQRLAVTIDAGTSQEVHLSGPQIMAAFRTYLALEAEANLQTLLAGGGAAASVLADLLDYSGYLIGEMPTAHGLALSLAPPAEETRLPGKHLAAFTSHEAFLAYTAATGQLAMRSRQFKDGAFWGMLAQLGMGGVVFNCHGPGQPLEFGHQLAAMVLDTQKRSA